jgi:DNA-binding GntR family transcriptional regulator
VEVLQALHESLIAAERSKSYEAAIVANFDFHFGIYRRSGLHQLISILENLWTQLGPMLNYLYPDGHPTYDGAHQHENMLAALTRREAAALRQAARDDMIEGGRNFVRVLESLEDKEIER